jgi:hypothetical protein
MQTIRIRLQYRAFKTEKPFSNNQNLKGMSFKGTSLPIGRFVANWGKRARSYNSAQAIINASRLNQAITVEDLQKEIGKKRQFKLSYYPIVCDVEANNNDTVCDSGERLTPKSIIYQLEQTTKSKVWELAQEDVRVADDGGLTFSEHAKTQIASTMPAMRKLLASQMLTLIIANVGVLPDGNTSRRLSFSNSTNGAINPIGLFEMQRIFADAGFDMPYAMGGAEIDTWKKGVAIGGVNAQGQRIDQLSTDMLYYDDLVNQVIGDGGQHVIAWDPSVLKFIPWSKNQGKFATDLKSVDDLDKLFKQSLGGKIKGSFLDPVLGILWDFEAKYDDCDEVWKWQLSLIWDIFFMPDQVCGIQGMNGIMHFTTCPLKIATCPDGDDLPSPASSRTYSWTPGSIFPRYIANMELGGFASLPNVNVTSIDDLVAAMNDNSNGIVFSKSGSNIVYTGYTAITGSINDGNITITFS